MAPFGSGAELRVPESDPWGGVGEGKFVLYLYSNIKQLFRPLHALRPEASADFHVRILLRPVSWASSGPSPGHHGCSFVACLIVCCFFHSCFVLVASQLPVAPGTDGCC